MEVKPTCPNFPGYCNNIKHETESCHKVMERYYRSALGFVCPKCESAEQIDFGLFIKNHWNHLGGFIAIPKSSIIKCIRKNRLTEINNNPSEKNIDSAAKKNDILPSNNTIKSTQKRQYTKRALKRPNEKEISLTTPDKVLKVENRTGPTSKSIELACRHFIFERLEEDVQQISHNTARPPKGFKKFIDVLFKDDMII